MIDVGMSQPMKVDLQVSCMRKPCPPAAVPVPQARMSTIQAAAVQQLFDEIDQDGDGSISHSELNRALKGKRKKKLREMFEARNLNWKDVFAKLDSNNDGVISLQEFMDGCRRE